MVAAVVVEREPASATPSSLTAGHLALARPPGSTRPLPAATDQSAGPRPGARRVRSGHRGLAQSALATRPTPPFFAGHPAHPSIPLQDNPLWNCYRSVLWATRS